MAEEKVPPIGVRMVSVSTPDDDEKILASTFVVPPEATHIIGIRVDGTPRFRYRDGSEDE